MDKRENNGIYLSHHSSDEHIFTKPFMNLKNASHSLRERELKEVILVLGVVELSGSKSVPPLIRQLGVNLLTKLVAAAQQVGD